MAEARLAASLWVAAYLARLAQVTAGCELDFVATDLAGAAALRQADAQAWVRWQAAIRPLAATAWRMASEPLWK